MKIGVVDVGGGFRGIYASAVLDRCLEENMGFDLGIGVSAGSANLASFVAGQKGRNYRFYTVYGQRSKYAGLGNFIFKRSFIDLDYVYSTLSDTDGEDPLDHDAFSSNPMEFLVVATKADDASPMYFRKTDMPVNGYDALKASSAIPGVCRPYGVNGVEYFDGALADPVPIDKAFEEGCDKVVLILTKPKDLIREQGSDIQLAKMIERKYPDAAQALLSRADNYNAGVSRAKELESERKTLIISPDDTCGVSTLTRKRGPLDKLYAKGFEDGAKIKDFISG